MHTPQRIDSRIMWLRERLSSVSPAGIAARRGFVATQLYYARVHLERVRVLRSAIAKDIVEREEWERELRHAVAVARLVRRNRLSVAMAEEVQRVLERRETK